MNSPSLQRSTSTTNVRAHSVDTVPKRAAALAHQEAEPLDGPGQPLRDRGVAVEGHRSGGWWADPGAPPCAPCWCPCVCVQMPVCVGAWDMCKCDVSSNWLNPAFERGSATIDLRPGRVNTFTGCRTPFARHPHGRRAVKQSCAVSRVMRRPHSRLKSERRALLRLRGRLDFGAVGRLGAIDRPAGPDAFH